MVRVRVRVRVRVILTLRRALVIVSSYLSISWPSLETARTVRTLVTASVATAAPSE